MEAFVISLGLAAVCILLGGIGEELMKIRVTLEKLLEKKNS